MNGIDHVVRRNTLLLSASMALNWSISSYWRHFIPGMFAVGVGWNIAHVASTAILADAAETSERGRLLGFSDFVAIIGAALLSVAAGLVLDSLGLPALVVAAVLLALVPAALFVLGRGRLRGATVH